MAARTFPDPALRAAERERNAARQVWNAADAHHRRLLTDRTSQRADEARLEHLGRTPYYVPKHRTPDNNFDVAEHNDALIYRWCSDDELAKAAVEVEEAKALLDKAEKAYESARAKAKPLSEPAQLAAAAKVNGYISLTEWQLHGEWISPGEVIKPEALEGIDWPKLNHWLHGRRPLLRKV